MSPVQERWTDLWLEVVEAGSRNPEVLTPKPRKWTVQRLRQLRAIDEYLDGDWSPLVTAVREASTGGAEFRLDLSLERLTSKGCERLDSLLSGKWRSPQAHRLAQIERQRERDREREQRAEIDAARFLSELRGAM